MKRRLFLGCLGSVQLGAISFAAESALAIEKSASASDSAAADYQTQVLVVGGGFAGLSAAVTAARAGAKVILVDKRFWLGGDGLMSTGMFVSTKTPLHEKVGIIQGVSEADYWKRLENGLEDEPISKVRDNQLTSPIYDGIAKHNPEVLRATLRTFPRVIEFVSSFGVEFLPIDPSKPFQMPSKRGSTSAFAKGAMEECKKLGVTILQGLKAEELLVDANGKVAGIKAQFQSGKDKGKTVTIKADAVVLSTGGFLNSEYLMGRYKRFWTKAKPGFSRVGEGVPNDHMGEGILMAKKVGAAIEDMESMPKLYAAPKEKVPGVSWILFDVDSGYLVDKKGKRFVNENEARYSGAALKALQLNLDGAHVLFGEDTFTGKNKDRWQYEKALAGGGLFKGATVEEVAVKAGVDAAGLKETIDRINKDATTGKDSEFGRTDSLFKAIRAPYYLSIAQYPVSFKTEGGLEVNPRFEVLSFSDETPIPGLFAAGSTVGSISTRLSDVVASGLLVGEAAAKMALGK